jgi:hypothetical protein
MNDAIAVPNGEGAEAFVDTDDIEAVAAATLADPVSHAGNAYAPTGRRGSDGQTSGRGSRLTGSTPNPLTQCRSARDHAHRRALSSSPCIHSSPPVAQSFSRHLTKWVIATTHELSIHEPVRPRRNTAIPDVAGTRHHDEGAVNHTAVPPIPNWPWRRSRVRRQRASNVLDLHFVVGRNVIHKHCSIVDVEITELDFIEVDRPA